ncbi:MULTISPECIES: hypothetical protein [Acinetobacter]|uniref:Uncharacterized protein n=1 Tax=Acinetobacter parvus DSM 16617 = CIP 108168 TaxID=981333 RepID=N8QDK1_9GAMM|nr:MULTISPECIES: hypothetical protein [Acinetobacter]ENU11642.1 hypothetical protein F996_03057 [Acinetobacter baumannii NIPH 24]ENU36580.1 hypothetical protein F988_01213 [Acinetobacter parvus DSM 16617 = CIP 108168]ENU59055.1 hypothetical protein F981_03364 [Acinetobacter guillouiae CIP 63.46]ENU84410.1 hypothetical protein F974_00472 [Acinetobacter sp. CIP 102159]ENU89774.1 hypothetical protein F972_00814 [Acinetobacter sp. CIP 102529]
MSIISIKKLGDESFLLKMKDKKSFDVLVETIKGNFGYSFNQGLQLNADILEIVIAGVSEENLKRHLAVVSF